MNEEYSLKSVYIKLTSKSLNKPVAEKEDHLTEGMSLVNFKRIISKLPDNLEMIYLHGGDPFILPSLESFVTTAKSKAEVALITNASQRPGSLEKYKKLIRELHVCIKYPNNELHDEWNRNKGSYRVAIDLLLWAKKNKIQSFIRWQVDSLNYIYLLRMLKLCKEYGAGLYLGRKPPIQQKDRELFLPEEQWKFVCKDAHAEELIPVTHTGENNIRLCDAGIGSFEILPTGQVTFSIDTQEVYGDLLNEDLTTVVANLRVGRVAFNKCKFCPCIAEAKKRFVPLEFAEKVVNFP